MKKCRFIKYIENNLYIILYLGIVVVIGLYIVGIFLYLKKDFFNYFPNILLITITFLYVIETRRIARGTLESVEATKELVKATIMPKENKRKNTAKNILFEINDNINLIKEIRGSINEMDEDKYNFYPVKSPDFLFYVYENFTEYSFDIDFKNEDLIPFIRNYYYHLKDIKEVVLKHNRKAGEKYDNKDFGYLELQFKIPIVEIEGDKLFIMLEEESEFKYSKKNYFYRYEPISFNINEKMKKVKEVDWQDEVRELKKKDNEE